MQSKVTAKIMALMCAAALVGCSDRNDAAEDKVEREAEANAVAAGPVEAALGLTEAQLLAAELIGPNNVELGDVIQVERSTDGMVSRLLIEIEDSNPDRFVYVPITGLTTIARGNDMDLVTSMTPAQLKVLPEVKLPPS